MATKKKVAETENNLPDHIKDIVLQPHHIYASKNRKTGEITLSTTKDLVTDLMRHTFNPGLVISCVDCRSMHLNNSMFCLIVKLNKPLVY